MTADTVEHITADVCPACGIHDPPRDDFRPRKSVEDFQSKSDGCNANYVLLMSQNQIKQINEAIKKQYIIYRFYVPQIRLYGNVCSRLKYLDLTIGVF